MSNSYNNFTTQKFIFLYRRIMYYFQAMKNLNEFKDYILNNLGKELNFGDMEFYYILGADNYLKIYEVDLDEFDIPTPIWKGCFGTNISVLIEEWKTK